MNSTVNLPIGLPTLWYAPQDLAIPNANLKNWLLDTGSLTERLQANCLDFKVQVLYQCQANITVEELKHLTSNVTSFAGQDWQIREVILWGNGEPWVFARSILPQQLCEAELANWGAQPLGKLIFNDNRFSRLPFQIIQLSSPNPVSKTLQLNSDMPLWGRRSVFQFNQLPMSVAEIFLPCSPAYSALSELGK